MGKTHNLQLRKTTLASAITASIGFAATGLPGIALSDVYTWGALGGPASNTTTCTVSPDAAAITFTMLDGGGAALANSSITTKGANTFQTPTCGTLTYDSETSSGTAEIVAFDFFAGTTPAEAVGINIDAVGDGLGGTGSLIFGNMLFNWNGNVGIPVSVVWDAQALLDEMDGTPTGIFTLNADGSINTSNPLSGTADTPASDGTYTDSTWGYLGVGPVPVATTAWNATPNCTPLVDCMGNATSGVLPVVNDSLQNANDYSVAGALSNTGGTSGPPNFDTTWVNGTFTNVYGAGGSPMLDGPFTGFNANFDFTSIKLISFTDNTAPTVAMNGTSPLTLTQGDTYTELGATCTDAAPLNTDLNASVVIGGDTVDTNTIGIYNVTYDCQDPSTNSAATLTRIVNVVAPGVPSITLLGTTPLTHECATTYTDAGATASDPEDGDISADIIATPNDGVTLTLGTINEGTVASQTIDYDVQDSGGTPAPTVTRTVNVVDTTDPVITLLGNNPEDVFSSTPENNATYTDPTADATDTCDSVLFPVNITATSGTVDMLVPDDGAVILPYTLLYSQTDSSGNSTTVSRVVNVERSQPVITLIGGGLVLNVGDTYTEQGMDIIDAQDLPGGGTLNVTSSGSSSGLTYTIDASSVDTSTQGSYSVTYDVLDSDGNNATQVTRDVTVGAYAQDSNFTMLDTSGSVIGGTNDVVFNWDQTENTAETDLNFNAEIYSQASWPFNGFPWFAHDTRVFGPGTYSFDTGCTVSEIQATGCPAGTATTSGPAISMTVGPGQVGAHMLFDWNTTSNIDVVLVWDRDAAWNQLGATDPQNKLWLGTTGPTPDPATDWKLVSRDVNGDGFNGAPMVDGPFQNFYANFNIGPLTAGAPLAPYTGTAPDTKIGSGLFASPMNPWVLFTVLLSLLGLRRFSKKQ